MVDWKDGRSVARLVSPATFHGGRVVPCETTLLSAPSAVPMERVEGGGVSRSRRVEVAEMVLGVVVLARVRK